VAFFFFKHSSYGLLNFNMMSYASILLTLPYSAAVSECKFEFQVCKIVPRQCYQKKLEASQVSTLRKSACVHPEPEQSCHQVHDLTALRVML